MGSLDVLKQEVDSLYTSENHRRSVFADWLYKNHVYQVAEASADVAKRFGGTSDVAYAAGLLHDVADAVMPRFEEGHALRSTEIARDILTKAGFSSEEIEIVLDDALRYHSCHGMERPQTLEGKALATGDAIAHLTTDFYLYMATEGDFAKSHSKEEVAATIKGKIDRDFDNKIAYEEIREEVRSAYEQLKEQFHL